MQNLYNWISISRLAAKTT